LKIFGVTVEYVKSGLASRAKALNFAMNVRILRTLRVLGMKESVKLARKGERTLGKRFCGSKLEMLAIGLRSKTRSGVALIVAVACGGSRRPVFSAVSLLVDVRCLRG
jgi:hypothetical protein